MYKALSKTGAFLGLPILWIGITCAAFAQSNSAPVPTPAPSGPGNIFYGGVNPGANAQAPVLLFVHGLGANATYWFTNGNDMYQYVYNAGYRSAYISFNIDNSDNHSSIADNAATLQQLMPQILQHFGVQQVYLVCHSKGGLDAEVAMEDNTLRSEVKAIFTLATPNQGTALADWAYGTGERIASKLGILSDGLYDLRPEYVAQLRGQLDPIFQSSGIPFYFLEGSNYSADNSALFRITGPILKNLTDGVDNDGLVAVPEVQLPDSYGEDMGEVPVDHVEVAYGVNSWSYVYGRISGLEMRQAGWQQIANGGFGDDQNTWAWSQIWFQGNLYVGTGRNVDCVTSDTAAAQTGLPLYPPPADQEYCPQDPLHIATPAEIWRYTPQTKTWTRVYVSPQDIPLGNDANGNPAYAARSIGFRGMGIYTESDGTQALYVGGVSAISIYNTLPMYNSFNYPPPILLRSTDGQNFTEVPEDPGTYLGDIVGTETDIFVSSFRSIVQANGQMFVAVTDFRGEGFIMASQNPSGGDNNFQRVSPTPALPDFAVWIMAAYNNALYVGTGDRTDDTGYGVYECTNMPGDPVPYTFTPVIEQGGYQTNQIERSPTALTMHVWQPPGDPQQHLYVGTDRKVEVVRVNPDNSWDVVVGQPRNTPVGFKTPLSGIGYFFGNDFNQHAWQMNDSPNTGLHVSTWDFSILLRTINALSSIVTGQQGFDFYDSPDGIHFYIVSNNGMGDGYNMGGRSSSMNHFGLFWGTARVLGGLQEWQDNTILDLNGDGKITQSDANIIQAAIGQPATAGFDPRDVNDNGTIDAQDVQYLESQCTFPNCAETAPSGIAYTPPAAQFAGFLTSATQTAVGNATVLSWPAQPNAVRYHVYRITNTPVGALLESGIPPQTIQISQDLSLNFPNNFTDGTLNVACPDQTNDLWYCQMSNLMVDATQTPPGQIQFVGFPATLVEIAQPPERTYSEALPTPLQSIYFVRSEDNNGNLSQTSNIVGAPSFTDVDQSQF